MTSLIIVLSLVIVILVILYLSEFKFELKYTKTNPETEKTDLDKLSNTELNILKHIAEGKTNQEIADKLFISVNTVKKHASNIFKKLNLSSRSEARKYKKLTEST